jgi:predicted outer membrane protein
MLAIALVATTAVAQARTNTAPPQPITSESTAEQQAQLERDCLRVPGAKLVGDKGAARCVGADQRPVSKEALEQAHQADTKNP